MSDKPTSIWSKRNPKVARLLENAAKVQESYIRHIHDGTRCGVGLDTPGCACRQKVQQDGEQFRARIHEIFGGFNRR